MKDKILPMTIEYQYKKDDQALEEVFTYLFDEIQKVINSNQLNEQKSKLIFNKNKYAYSKTT